MLLLLALASHVGAFPVPDASFPTQLSYYYLEQQWRMTKALRPITLIGDPEAVSVSWFQPGSIQAIAAIKE